MIEAAAVLAASWLIGVADDPAVDAAVATEAARLRVTAHVLERWPGDPRLAFRVAEAGAGTGEPSREPAEHRMTADEFEAFLARARDSAATVTAVPPLDVPCGGSASARVITSDPAARPAGLLVGVAPQCLADGRVVLTLDFQAYGLTVRPPASEYEGGDRVSIRGARMSLDEGDVGFALAAGYVGAPFRLVAISCRRIPPGPAAGSDGEWVPLFDGRSLDGWVPVGGRAAYDVDDGCIRGVVGPGANSFLRTVRAYRDFDLRLEVRLDERGNSGIQFRSHQRDGNGRVYGYQCEIDPSPRAWSGGIYDESRRGWLHPLDHDERARAAFDVDGWNEYRILAVGDRLRTWVNGVPCADLTDRADAEGFIALQVHSGQTGRIRWRNIRIRELAGRQ